MPNILKVINAYANPKKLAMLFFMLQMCVILDVIFVFILKKFKKGLKPNLMTLEEIDQFSSSLNGLLQLSLTGGEPFRKKRFQ